ncbi:hypothetical protein [Endozoicomonas sp. Mp262]|uniref:RNA ligase family protein n=1 Tax=Endozoicomonas sp. Mp262 TaxID=2919499 RepID=UPI0021E06406
MNSRIQVKRKLASVRRVEEISSIDETLKKKDIPGYPLNGKCLARIGGWTTLVEEGEFNKGDLVVFCEIDSFLPKDIISYLGESLKKSNIHKEKTLDDGRYGYWVSTKNINGILTQGAILSIAVLGEKVCDYKHGDDVTDILKVTKYETPLDGDCQGTKVPGFIRAASEERVQNLGECFDTYKGLMFFVSEKLNGTSVTYFIKDGEFGICSRTKKLERPAQDHHNWYWKIAEKYSLEDKLKESGKNIAIQGEIVGPNIEGNIYKLMEHELYIYNIFDIDLQRYISKSDMMARAMELELKTCPVLYESITIPDTIKDLLSMANGSSALNQRFLREGMVCVCDGDNGRVSFKVVSNVYLASKDKSLTLELV